MSYLWGLALANLARSGVNVARLNAGRRCCIELGRASLPWSLAIVQPQRELSIARALKDWDFENHCFKIRRRVVHRGRALVRLLPAFPRYLFVEPRNRFDVLRTGFGVRDFVREDGGRIAVLPECTVNSLVRLADADDVLPTPDIPSRFKHGDRVLIRGASLLSGYPGIFQHLASETEAVILIDWMGRYVPLAVDERDLAGESEVTKPMPRRKRRRRRERARERREIVAATERI